MIFITNNNQKLKKRKMIFLNTKLTKNTGKSTSCGSLLTLYNHVQNILRLFDVSQNFPFTTSKMMHDY